MTEYSVEEKLGRIEAIIQGLRPSHDAYITQAVGLLRAYAERIQADERMVPVAWQQKRRPEDYPDEWRECSKAVFDTIKRTKNSPWIARELFAASPASSPVRGDGGEG